MDEDFMNESMYESFSRGTFDHVFECVSNLLCDIKQKGVHSYNIDEFNKIKDETKNLLSIAMNLIKNGAPDPYFHFILNFEFLKRINSINHISDYDLAELFLMKNLIIYFRHLDLDKFFGLASSICSTEVSCKILIRLENVFNFKY